VVGGLQRGLDADLRTLHHVWMPGLGDRKQTNRVQSLHTELRAFSDILGLSATRLTLGAQAHDPATLLQLDARGDIAAQPLFQLAAMSLEAGLACRVETQAGLELARCANLASWSGWVALRTVPGRAPGLP
jgi:hypothetical protein